MRIPQGWGDVDAAWMTDALAADFPGAVVEHVDLVLVDDGTNRRARFALGYAAGSGPGPATVFLKAADPSHTEVNARTGGVLHEARLFASGVSLPVDHPRVHCSILDEQALDYVMVMEDVVAAGGDPLDATRPMTVDQAASAVRGLAQLHGSFWNQRLVREPRLSWVEPFLPWRGMATGIDMGLERAGDAVPDEVRRLTGKQIMVDHWVRFVDTLVSGDQTLLHGDPHIGNTYALPNGGIGFLDWQVVRRGNPSLDLGYLLQGALTVADRRAHERDLVDEYLAALPLTADERPDRDDVWLRYRASTAYGLAIWLVTAASDWQRLDISLALSERHATAWVDLDGAAATDALT